MGEGVDEGVLLLEDGLELGDVLLVVVGLGAGFLLKLKQLLLVPGLAIPNSDLLLYGLDKILLL